MQRASNKTGAVSRHEDALSFAEGQAVKAETRLREAIEHLPEGIVFLDEDGRYILWNRRYAEIYHKSADLFEPGAKLEDTLRIGVARGDYPEAYGREEAWLADRLSRLKNPGQRHEQQLADGRWIMIEEQALSEGGVIGIRVDITEMKRREESFRLLFDANPVPMFLYDAETRGILSANQAASDHYGHDPLHLIGLSVLELYEPESRKAVRSFRCPEGAWRHRTASGQTIEVALFSREMDYEGRAAVLMAVLDVTERKRAEARVSHMARHDVLTNLPNRLLFRERVEGALAAAEHSGESFAIVLIDLDNFKTVNDTLGHSAGDRLLQEVAARMQAVVSVGDLVSRLGGDEFAVIHSWRGGRAASALIERISEAVTRPYDLDGHVVNVGASFGVAIAPRDGTDPDQLLKNADLALYRAKEEGRGVYRFFEPEMDARLRARRRMEADLREALKKGELAVHYQPLIKLSSGEVSGYEALLRWSHPERGMVSPAEFIPVAEELGLIGVIGQMVLNQACRDAATWPAHTKIAVNLSPSQFGAGNLHQLVVQALASSGLDAHRLELEITEAILMDKNEMVLSTLNALRELGVGISMDDFGTGYSSLSYLRSFPFTKIKIDQSFVKGLSESRDNQAIVRAILSLGSSLGMTVTAEGVERLEDLAYLQKEGCPEAQGFYFSAARPNDTLPKG